jgi:SAM-dependent methyltransferase
MRAVDLLVYRNPRTQGPLTSAPEGAERTALPPDIQQGLLQGEGDSYEVVRGIPRFCPRENYAVSFGFQWNEYDRLQLDSGSSWGDVSRERLFTQTAWPRDMTGERILEAGCGMGRFTEHLVATGADVWSIDYSAAIEANHRNNGRAPNLHLAQADILRPPFAAGSFDRVLCIGVIQHTPDPSRSFDSLVRLLKPGGRIAIDCYRLDWRTPFLGKYWLRPLTKRLTPSTLHRLVRAHVAWTYPLTGALQAAVGDRGRSLSWALALADYRGVYQADPITLRRLAELDTFDMLAPAHDHPQTLGQVRRWFARNGLEEVQVRPGWNGIEAVGRKPAAASAAAGSPGRS